MNRPARAWCWGAGWDSTAGIIEDVRRGIPIDMITFADHGGEKRRPDPLRGEQVGTYEFIPIFTEWLTDRGYPAPVMCKPRVMDDTLDRYTQAIERVVDDLNLPSITDDDIDRLARSYGNMVANDTLPGLAFGSKGCSFKWKIQAQEPL